jgi:hypothetical protein
MSLCFVDNGEGISLVMSSPAVAGRHLLLFVLFVFAPTSLSWQDQQLEIPRPRLE